MTNNQPKGQQVTDAKPDSVETLKRLVDDLDSEINNSWPIIDKAMASRVRDARPALAAAIAELEALRKVVARLPKDKHGQVVSVGTVIKVPSGHIITIQSIGLDGWIYCYRGYSKSTDCEVVDQRFSNSQSDE